MNSTKVALTAAALAIGAETLGWDGMPGMPRTPASHRIVDTRSAGEIAATRRQADGSWRFVIDNPWGTD